jgi:glycosyltransferase involved in cell wall biosynthesis
MTVHHYAITWNEARVLGFFFRHYDAVVDRYVIFDDGSTDGTLEMLRAHPKVELRRFERRDPDSLVLSMLAVYNEVWKESRGRADWVFVTNIDEHLYHPRLADYLADCRRDGVTAIPALGYQMVSETFPPASATLCETVRQGAAFDSMSKLQIFNPDAIREINYAPGRHTARPRGRIRWPERDEVLNLHYKFLERDYVRQRHAALGRGLGKTDLRERFAVKYLWDSDKLDRSWNAFARRAVDVGDPGLQPWNSHRAPRWWRERFADRLGRRLRKQWRRWMAVIAPAGLY